MPNESYVTIFFPKDKTFVTLQQNANCIKYLQYPDVLVKYPKGLWRGRIIGQSGMRQFLYLLMKVIFPFTILTTMGAKFVCEKWTKISRC